VVDTKAVVADMKVAVVDTIVAADTTKLPLHSAAVCTKSGGAYQLRRFVLAKAFQVSSRPNGRRTQMDKMRAACGLA
jgi:hypothetical protein